MSREYIITEYKEEINKKADELLQPGSVLDAENPPEDGEHELSIVFRESPMEMADPLVQIPASEVEDVVAFSELPEEIDGIVMPEEELELDMLPGSDVQVNSLEESAEPEPEPETDWKNDRDSSKFMEYLMEAYPGGIPRHDGKSIAGLERAINYLNRLNKQISEAIRADREDTLDTAVLDKYRVNIMKDMLTLKEHSKKLQSQIREQHKSKRASLNSDGTFTKEGSIPIPTLVMTPFERAISGIIINSVISAGHPFEDVYEHLKKKYELTDREELAVMQLVMDMGFPLFKDRGTYSSSVSGYDDEKQGLDFIKNYLA
jgi:hypothetical protein